MWQLLLLAAAATSGYLAKRFIGASATSQTLDLRSDQQRSDGSSESHVQDHLSQLSCELLHHQKDRDSSDTLDVHRSKDAETRDGVFRFSSVRVGLTRSRNLAAGSGPGRRKNGAPKRKRISVRLKRNRNSDSWGREGCDPGLGGGSSFSQGNPLFSWGISMGVMLMASVGKNEMDKLSVALDETGKLIHELKTELHTRKCMRSSHASTRKCAVAPPKEEMLGTEKPIMLEKFDEEGTGLDPISTSSLAKDGSGEYASSVVTEESNQRTLEMRELEAELESELEKISCSVEQDNSHPERGLSEWDMMDPDMGLITSSKVTLSHSLRGSHELPNRHGLSILYLEHKLHNLHMENQETCIQESNSIHQPTLMKMHSQTGDDEFSGDSTTFGTVRDEAWKKDQNCYVAPKKDKPVKQESLTLRKKRTLEAELSCHYPINASYGACL